MNLFLFQFRKNNVILIPQFFDMLHQIIKFLEDNSLSCPTKSLFGIECPGCGTQMAFIELLKGNILESIKTFPPLIPLMLMIFYLILFLIFRFKHGTSVLKISFIINAIIITIHFIYRLTLHFL